MPKPRDSKGDEDARAAMRAVIELDDIGTEIADEVLSAFSKLHPRIRMNHGEWWDLGEMIKREAIGHFMEGDGDRPNASDLLPKQEAH